MALIATVDSTGISAPDFPTVLAGLKDLYRGIYGADVYLEPDSQDGSFLAMLALVVNDVNSLAISVYNSFSPATAFGEGLSRVVKINGIARAVASRSSVTLRIGGTAGTSLINPQATDETGNSWVVPGTVLIPVTGTVDVQAIALTLGAISAPAGSVDRIGTPARGWQTVSNPTPAIPGAPVELDAVLRIRQASSTALPSTTIFEGIVGALLNVLGVTRVRGYQNDSAAVDANGTAPYSVRFVVEGGADLDVANVIGARKTPGVLTQGASSVTITNAYGLQQVVNFDRLVPVPHYLTINLKANPTYTSALAPVVIAAVVAYANSLPIGMPLLINRVIGIIDAISPNAFDVVSVLIGTSANGQSANNVPIAYNQAVQLLASNVSLGAA